jgi:hypothetical protein
MTIPDLHIPLCPRCGEPVTSGCYPDNGICAVIGDEKDGDLHFGSDDVMPLCDPMADMRSRNGVVLGGTLVFDWDAVTCPACLAKRGNGS